MAKRHVLLAIRALAVLPCLALMNGVLQAQDEATALLKSATDLRCTFSSTTRTLWKAGEPQPTSRPATGPTIVIRNINPSSGSALQVREPINKDLTFIDNPNERHFIDAGGGKVTVTVVLSQFTSGRKLRAAQYSHDYTALDLGSFKAEPEVAFNIGECEVIPPAQ